MYCSLEHVYDGLVHVYSGLEHVYSGLVLVHHTMDWMKIYECVIDIVVFQDCTDGTDESNCTAVSCPDDKFNCPQVSHNYSDFLTENILLSLLCQSQSVSPLNCAISKNFDNSFTRTKG